MPHTLWHCGVLLGEARLRASPGFARQIVGPFRPTAHGLEILPRLTGPQSVATPGAPGAVELRAPDGTALSVESLAFIDLQRLRSFGRTLGRIDATPRSESLPPGAPRFLVSATLASRSGPVPDRVIQ